MNFRKDVERGFFGWLGVVVLPVDNELAHVHQLRLHLVFLARVLRIRVGFVNRRMGVRALIVVDDFLVKLVVYRV